MKNKWSEEITIPYFYIRERLDPDYDFDKYVDDVRNDRRQKYIRSGKHFKQKELKQLLKKHKRRIGVK
jgi:hypothetical protein